MTLGPEFRHADRVEKAVRRVRTAAGMKFFKAPIGTVITPGMVAEARAQHGEKKTQAILDAQKRNAVRDGRRQHFANQAQVRHTKRQTEADQRAAQRERARQKAEMEAAPKQALASPPPQRAQTTPGTANPVVLAPTTAPKTAVPDRQRPAPNRGRVLTHAQTLKAFELIDKDGKLSPKQIAEAEKFIKLLMPSPDAHERAMVEFLRNQIARSKR